MAEEIQEQEVKKEEVETKELSRNELIDQVIMKLRSDDFTVHFYCPAMPKPSGGVGVLLRLASHLSKRYKVKVWYEPIHDQQLSMQESNKAKKRIDIFRLFNHDWIDFDVSKVEFKPLGDKEAVTVDKDGKMVKFKTSPLQVNSEDFLVIPEGFPNVMQMTAQITCKRIVLAQSWAYVLTGMQSGQSWANFGIRDVISVSDAITEFINTTMGGMRIKKIRQGIDRDIFKIPEKKSFKKPMIAYMTPRGEESRLKITNIIKMFQAVNPHYRWVRFVEIGGMKREEFAERLSEFAFCLYTDEIAGFGTLPLEAMATGTHVVGWFPFGSKEYVSDKNGFWAQNGEIFQMVELLGVALDKWLSGEMDTDVIQTDYETVLEKYTVEGEEDRIIEIFKEYKTERTRELEQAKTN